MHLAEEYDCEIDLSDPESVRRAFAEAARRAGKLDAVVHTVGTCSQACNFVEACDREYLELFQANVLTTVHVLRASLALMLPQREGSVAIVGSRDALRGSTGRCALAASRAAQLSVIESAAAEAWPLGVRVNGVLPGILDTAANRTAMPDADRSSWLQLRDAAEVLSFLISPAAAAIHGQAIEI
jgi:NAD(P)-dependent dehydrogenase (short-subunit alcohol dehydrogenase family)